MCFALTGCSLTRVIPIQLVRVSQTESYLQTFSFLKPSQTANDSKDGSPTTIQGQNQRMDETFTKLLGPINWQNLKDLYGLGSLRNELIQNKIYLQGIMNVILYIDPVEHESFLLEGFGRYFLVRKKTSAILLSGDFHIPLKSHFLDELDRGFVIIDVKLFVTRVPEQITYLNEVPLRYKIYIDNRMKNDKIYSIDYTQKHKTYLEDDIIAEITLQDTGHGAKLIDLRGIGFLKNDYQKKLRESRKVFMRP